MVHRNLSIIRTCISSGTGSTLNTSKLELLSKSNRSCARIFRHLTITIHPDLYWRPRRNRLGEVWGVSVSAVSARSRNTISFMIFHIHINCFGCSRSITFWGVFCSTQRFLFTNCKKTKLVGYVAVCRNLRSQRLTCQWSLKSPNTLLAAKSLTKNRTVKHITNNIWSAKHQQGQPSNWSS